MERSQVDSIVELAAQLAGQADSIEEVIVIYTVKDKPGAYSLDNSITVASAVFLVECFKHFLMTCMTQPKE
jgi:hypothetical protein